MNQQRFPTIRRIGRWCVRVAPRVGFGLLVLFVLVAIPWTYFNIKWGRELEAKLAELKAQGMPLTPAEAAPKPVPDSQNAAVLYQEVFKVQFPPTESIFGEGAMGGLSQDDRNVFSAYLKEPTRELESQVRKLLARPQVQQALNTLRRGSQRPYSVFPVKWEQGAAALFPHMGMFRAATYIITTRALLLADEGRVKEALDWCRVSLRMSEHAASEPTLIGQLVATAMQAITLDAVERIISEQQLEPGVANDFADYLSRINLYKSSTVAMAGEQAYGIETMEQLRRGEYRRSELVRDHLDLSARADRSYLIVQLYSSWLGRPLWKLDELALIQGYGKVVRLTAEPYVEAASEWKRLKASRDEIPRYLVLTRKLSPLFSGAMQKRDHAVASIGLCRVVLALKAYKYERGAYPQSLAQLQETLDWQLPEDPFSGADFVYQRQEEGFKLYSIGQDLEDDGGIAPKEPPQNLHRDEADIVWECSR